MDDTLVCIFSHKDRTLELSKYCFEQLGFKNIVVLNDDSGFDTKYRQFVSLGLDSGYEYFIRSDGDCLVFDEILTCLNKFRDDKNILWYETFYFDYFMNRFRGGTPHVMRRELLKMVRDKNLIIDAKKPETKIWERIPRHRRITVKRFTNLHEYEQYPSKVYRSYKNRISRGNHHRLYDKSFLSTLPDRYYNAIMLAEKSSSLPKTINYQEEDLDFLDRDFGPIQNLDDMYIKYKKLYEEKHETWRIQKI